MANLLFLTFLLLGIWAGSTTSLTVVGVVGGGAVVNNSRPLVVMDCHYKISPGEEAGLTVTWYYGNNPTPVFQWIPGSYPQALGLLKDRLDLKYQSSPDALRQYTALAFIAPTTELAGDYTCKVGTYYAEGSATGKFMVYTPPSEFDMKMSKPSLGKVTIGCKGVDSYPEPKITLFKTDVRTQRRSLMATRYQKDYSANSNHYTLSAEASILGHQLIGETQFECLLTIPGTDYRLQETLLYYPGAITAAHTHSGRSAYSGTEKMKSGLFTIIALSAIAMINYLIHR